MRSGHSEPKSEASAADRIVDMACARIAADGVTGTSVRSVAGAAGVSPALVIHHFGSKAGLVAACDERVRAALDEAIRPVVEGAEVDSVTRSLVHLMTDTPYAGYITRSLRDGGELGSGLFDLLFELSLETDRELQDRGAAHPARDPELRALLVLVLDLGMLMLAPHVERVLGSSLRSAETTRRWVEAELELLTRPTFTGVDLTADTTEER